ncbi:MAG TPA: hypothetical protein VF403_25195 [Kofleriaceae bacterium]
MTPSTAAADDASASSQLVMIPIECAQFWQLPSGPTSPNAWDAVLSFAACIQDATAWRATSSKIS